MVVHLLNLCLRKNDGGIPLKPAWERMMVVYLLNLSEKEWWWYTFFYLKIIFLIAVLYESDLRIYFSVTIRENKKINTFYDIIPLFLSWRFKKWLL